MRPLRSEMSAQPGFTDIDSTLCADGVPLTEIAAAHGTPCYVYSAGQIIANVRALQNAFKGADLNPHIAFACKANSNIAVLSVMNSLGLGADVVSGGEMMRAQKAGIAAGKIVFSGVGKTDDEISAAIAAGVLQINAESRPELERIAAIAAKANRKAPVALRFNPDVDAGTHAKITTGKSENKFGMPEGEAAALYEWMAKQPYIIPRGISIHIGSQLTDIAPYKQAFTKLAALAQKLVQQGLSVPALDIGGGLGIVYSTEQAPPLAGYANLVRDIIKPLGTQIITEPGRLLTGNAGLLLTRALYIKESAGRKYLILDSGMNDLMRPALYDAWHGIRHVTQNGSTAEIYDIVGPVCETGDTFAKNRKMQGVKPGDLLAVMDAGAYGFVMASEYNTRPLPPETMAKEGKFALIRARESVQDIIERDIVPEWI